MPWLQEGGQVRLVGSESMDGFVSQLFLSTLNYDARSTTHQIGTEYLKHVIYFPFFSLQNAVCLIILTYLVPVLFTFYIPCAKIKKKIPAPKD